MLKLVWGCAASSPGASGPSAFSSAIPAAASKPLLSSHFHHFFPSSPQPFASTPIPSILNYDQVALASALSTPFLSHTPFHNSPDHEPHFTMPTYRLGKILFFSFHEYLQAPIGVSFWFLRVLGFAASGLLHLCVSRRVNARDVESRCSSCPSLGPCPKKHQSLMTFILDTTT